MEHVHEKRISKCTEKQRKLKSRKQKSNNGNQNHTDHQLNTPKRRKPYTAQTVRTNDLLDFE
jgi:hypothetical protein